MASLDETTLREVLDFAVEAAQLAGNFTLGHFNSSPPVELKADRSPVTAADRGAEESEEADRRQEPDEEASHQRKTSRISMLERCPSAS